MDCVFETYLNQEPGQLDSTDIPYTKEPVWILGKKYNPIQGILIITIINKSINFYFFRIGYNQTRYFIKIMVYLSKRFCANWWYKRFNNG